MRITQSPSRSTGELLCIEHGEQCAWSRVGSMHHTSQPRVRNSLGRSGNTVGCGGEALSWIREFASVVEDSIQGRRKVAENKHTFHESD